MTKTRGAAYRLSTMVAIFLAVITVIEYFAAQYTSSAVVMFILGLLKAYAVVNYFMHISRIWSSDGGH